MKKLVSFIVLFASAITINAQVNGTISAITDSEGNDLNGNNPKRGEVYTIEFSGFNIKDFHLKIGDETATVCCHPGGMPEQPSNCNIDVYPGSFTNCGKHTSAGVDSLDNSAGEYISLWKGGDSIASGEFQIRFNSGTPGTTPLVIFTSDGGDDPFNGVPSDDWNQKFGGFDGITLISTEEVPTLSEWGVIILILLTLSVGMVFLYIRETTLAMAGNIQAETYASKPKLFDIHLYAKVFGVVLLIGLALLGLSYLYFGEITSADPLGTFVSSAIVAYMVHFWMLKKLQSE